MSELKSITREEILQLADALEVMLPLFPRALPQIQQSIINDMMNELLRFSAHISMEMLGITEDEARNATSEFLMGQNEEAISAAGHLSMHVLEITDAMHEVVNAYDHLIGCLDESIKEVAETN